MTRFTHILCPVDLSENSSHALDQALAVARRYDDTRVSVLEVSWAALPPVAYPAAASMGQGPVLMAEERAALIEQLRQFTERPTTRGVKMDLILREGAVVPVILDEARARAVDLIVMGTHGRTGFDRFLLGSVTEKILRKASCAVMTVPPAARGGAPPEPLRTIVCAVDFSPASLKALAHALALAQESQATVILAHVLDWPTDRPLPPGTGQETAAHRREVQDHVTEELEHAVPADARDWCRPEPLVTIGRPHEEIVRIAHDRHADLIVMGVHGRAALTLALFGSTTNQVVRHAACPVLTIRG